MVIALTKIVTKLELDIMNPHFSVYYMNGKNPTDTYNPVPVNFYAVPAGTKIVFHVSGVTDKAIEGKSICDWLEMLLK